MGSQYAYGESAQQTNGQMPYYSVPRGFNTIAEHMNTGHPVEYVPHRLFVGGFGSQVSEMDLRQHFERYFTIRDVKVIRSNPDGLSKGYGFITFDTEEEARAVQAMSADQLKLNGRTLNLGPALRRMSRYSDYATATPNGQYSLTSTTMNYTHTTYPSQSQTAATPYMMGYAPQGMMPVSHHSLSCGEDSSASLAETSGASGEEQQQLQQVQQMQQTAPQPLAIHAGVQNSPQQLYSYYVPPPTPMTPTFRAFPFAPLYPHTPQMCVDGTTLYPQQMVATPLMYHPQAYYPPTPSMDASFQGAAAYCSPAATAAAAAAVSPTPVPLLQQLQQHYPPLVARGVKKEEEEAGQGGEEKKMEQGAETGQTDSALKLQPEAITSIGDIGVSYASIVKQKSTDPATVAKEVDQVSTQLGSMKMNGAGGDYAAAAKSSNGGGAPPRV